MVYHGNCEKLHSLPRPGRGREGRSDKETVLHTHTYIRACIMGGGEACN